MVKLIADLLKPTAFPDPQPNAVELRETHTAWVLLTDEDVFKIKKPVNFGFLDFSSLEKREKACRAEVILNSRLAQGIYKGIVPLTFDEKAGYQIQGRGQLVDWAVHMKRLPDANRADTLASSGSLTPQNIETLAELLAHFHFKTQWDSEISKFGEVSEIRYNLIENFSQSRPTLRQYLSPFEANMIERWQFGFLDGCSHRLHERVELGHIRDGHGDLRLEQIYFLKDPDRIVILDCIEFNDRFRYADTASDLAFLSMDLRFHERSDLAELLLSSYARESNDYGLYGVVDFYESYRAFVRGKVSSFLAQDPQASEKSKSHANALARHYYKLAYSKTLPHLHSQSLIAVGGLLASGKSTLAQALSRQLSAPVIDTDRTRKWLAGVSPQQSLLSAPWQGAYNAEISARVYEECLRRAETVIKSGRTAILDATFRSREMRLRARNLALKRSASFFFIECRVPHALARDRLKQREKTITISDGRLEIYDAFVKGFEPVTELHETEHLIADTTRPLHQVIQTLLKEAPMKSIQQEVLIKDDEISLPGTLIVPNSAQGIVIFAHGSGSSRLSPRNRQVAKALNESGLGTLLFDLLTEDESLDRSNVFDIPLLAGRLALTTRWLRRQSEFRDLPLAYFGASTGAAAALWAAADLGNEIGAVVSRGGRPDLAIPRLKNVAAPTLLIVGGNDEPVIEMNREALQYLSTGKLIIIPGATHLFEEPGALEAVAESAVSWFNRYLVCEASRKIA